MVKNVKKPVKQPKKENTKNTEPDNKPDQKKTDPNKQLIKEAVSKGLEIIKEGKSKADAARAIYGLLKDEEKEVIVAAFVEGATLTEKGALTYWYNCRRKAGNQGSLAS